MIVKPWEKQKGEQGKAYGAFQAYLELGYSRDLPAVSQNTGVDEQTLKRWYTQYKWKTRVEAWDGFVQEAHRKALIPALNKSSEEWANRRVAISEEEFQLAEKLKQKALDMLSMPLHEQIVQEIDKVTGRPVTIIVKPVKWTLRDAITAAQIFSELSRRSAGMSLNKSEVTMTISTDEEKLDKARLALDKLREEMAATLRDEELMETLRQLPHWIASDFGVKVTDLITDGGPSEQKSEEPSA